MRVFRAEDPDAHGQQLGELVPGGSGIPLLPDPAGELVPGPQGAVVLRTKHPLEHRQQLGELANPAASTVASSAANCHATPTWSR